MYVVEASGTDAVARVGARTVRTYSYIYTSARPLASAAGRARSSPFFIFIIVYD